MRIFLAATLFLAMLQTTAQNLIRLKVYHNTDNLEKTEDLPFPEGLSRERVWNFKRVSFAMEISGKKDLIHQLEIFFPQVARPTSMPGYPLNYTYSSGPFRHESTAISFRYEVSKKVAESGGLKFSVGLGINPYYHKLSNISTIDLYADRHSKNVGAAVTISGTLEMKLTDLLGLEIGLPLKVYDFRVESFRINNPSITIRQQTATKNEHIFFESAYTLRAGLICKIGRG
jgi:hypothetical protein